MTVEICVDSFEQAAAAEKYGAKRIELCSALEVGGLTPSIGMVQKCALLKQIEVHAMIRPRAGDFSYSSEELDIMSLDIESLSSSGVKGFVFGILKKNHTIDIKSNLRLLQQVKSKGLEATFHRAFDLAKDPLEALDQIIEMGFDRILTSGQKSKAIEGIDLIKQLALKANQRIQIMAGSGIDQRNIHAFQKIGIDAVHFTARKPMSQEIALGMGTNFEADQEKIESILKLLI